MPDLKIILAIIVFIIIILIMKNESEISESFDTYRNHSYMAQRIYNNKCGKKMSLDDAELEAKYRWNDAKICDDFKKGKPFEMNGSTPYTLYEAGYDEHVKNITYGTDFDSEYVYRGDDFADHDRHIDGKFDTLGATYSKSGDNYFATYDVNCMKDSIPACTTFHGEVITLSQT